MFTQRFICGVASLNRLWLIWYVWKVPEKMKSLRLGNRKCYVLMQNRIIVGSEQLLLLFIRFSFTNTVYWSFLSATELHIVVYTFPSYRRFLTPLQQTAVWKHSDKRRNCSKRAISPFDKMFSAFSHSLFIQLQGFSIFLQNLFKVVCSRIVVWGERPIPGTRNDIDN